MIIIGKGTRRQEIHQRRHRRQKRQKLRLKGLLPPTDTKTKEVKPEKTAKAETKTREVIVKKGEKEK